MTRLDTIKLWLQDVDTVYSGQQSPYHQEQQEFDKDMYEIELPWLVDKLEEAIEIIKQYRIAEASDLDADDFLQSLEAE